SDQYFVDLLTKEMSSPAIFDKEKIVEAVQLLGGMEQISDAINENSGFELSVLISNLLPATVRLGEDERRQNEDLRKQLATGNDLDSISFAQIWAVCAPVFIREIVLGLSHALADDLQRLRYLGPNRMAPDRHMIFSESGDGASHADGALAWDILMHHSEVRERVNQWLGGHPGLTSQQVAKAVLSGEREGRYDKWMKTPYRLFVDRHISIAEFRDALAAAFYERPLTLMERRELLTKDLATVFAALQQQYDTDQWRAEEYAKELRPWIERIQKAKSPADREQLIQEALAHFEEVEASKLQSPGVQWETEDEDLDEEAPLERAQARADQFIDSLDRRGVTGIAELRLRDINKQTAVSISDVGFGISQVLPVLTLAYGSHNNIIAIEQPEIHLHPELQAELADVFIESALGGHQNTFLLETHSEHLILRVMKRMRETWHKKESTRPPISPKDVAILYVEPLGTRSVVREIPLNDAGQLVKAWPGGFFEEGLKEQLDNA